MDKLNYFVELDKKFLHDVQTLGSEGWIKYLADDVVAAQVNYLNIAEGFNTISNMWREHYKTEDIFYTWKSRNFDISDDSTLVNYISEFYFHETINGKKLEYEGIYMFTWKLIKGEYKITKIIGAWKS